MFDSKERQWEAWIHDAQGPQLSAEWERRMIQESGTRLVAITQRRRHHWIWGAWGGIGVLAAASILFMLISRPPTPTSSSNRTDKHHPTIASRPEHRGGLLNPVMRGNLETDKLPWEGNVGPARLILALASRLVILDDHHIQLTRGSVKVDVEPGQGGFRVTTPVGEASVKGTKFQVTYHSFKEDTMNASMVVTVMAGLVEVFNAQGLVALAAHEEAVIVPGRQPARIARGVPAGHTAQAPSSQPSLQAPPPEAPSSVSTPIFSEEDVQQLLAHKAQLPQIMKNPDAAPEWKTNPYLEFVKAQRPVVWEALSKLDSRAQYAFWLELRYGRPLQEAVLNRKIQWFFYDQLDPKPGDSNAFPPVPSEEAFQPWRYQIARNGKVSWGFKDVGLVREDEIQRVKASTSQLNADQEGVVAFEKKLEGDPSFKRLWSQFAFDAATHALSHDQFYLWVEEAFGKGAAEWVRRENRVNFIYPFLDQGNTGSGVVTMDKPQSLETQIQSLHKLHPPSFGMIGEWGVLTIDPVTGRARVADQPAPRAIPRASWTLLPEGCEVKEAKDKTGGLLVTRVSPKSRAEKAGLQKGDHLLKFESRALTTKIDWETALSEFDPRSLVKLTGERAGTARTWLLQLEISGAASKPAPSKD